MDKIKITREEALRRWNTALETKHRMVERFERLARESYKEQTWWWHLLLHHWFFETILLQLSTIEYCLPCAAAPSAHQHSQFYCVKQPRATPTGRELVCEYRPSRPGFKSSLLRMGGFRREVEPLLAGEDGWGRKTSRSRAPSLTPKNETGDDFRTTSLSRRGRVR